ncbi:MAG: hypothetical protein EU531_04060 [Promethearchaeota archaeon]|nr:MAG: hypothetical protein EU531_04060 [Candidatus Lokiarchaeota archaeon]
MLSCKEILNLNNDSLLSYFKDTSIEEFLEPILIKFPDYYNLRGKELQYVSDKERAKAIQILISEME